MSRATVLFLMSTLMALACAPSKSFAQMGMMGGGMAGGNGYGQSRGGLPGVGLGWVPREAADALPYSPIKFEPVSAERARTWIKLNKKVDASFENDTTLKDFLAFVKKAASGPNEPALSVFAEPRGLKEKKITMDSTISMSLDKVPLATVLELALGQLELTFYVRQDGILVIDAEGSDRLPAERPKLTEKAAWTWLKLSKDVEVPFAEETTIQDVVKFLEQKLNADEHGLIPIYLDPESLQSADKTLESRIQLKLKRVPLATSMQLIFSQLDLSYVVTDDGMIMIVVPPEPIGERGRKEMSGPPELRPPLARPVQCSGTH